jgi:hypothetical protein
VTVSPLLSSHGCVTRKNWRQAYNPASSIVRAHSREMEQGTRQSPMTSHILG